MSISLVDLGLAYRKAKVDLFYSTNPSLFAIASYEKQLNENLQSLFERISDKDEGWVKNRDFCGGWTLAPKTISWPKRDEYREKYGRGLIFSSPSKEWESNIKTLASERGYGDKPNAEFRLMAQCSLDFHVLSALWMLKVGHLFDAKLSDCAYGNRLRRTQTREVNPLSLGSFVPYLKPFRDWRDSGLNAMRIALDQGKSIVALTADVTSFYHELNPDFMLNQHFLDKVLSLNLNDEQLKINRLFVNGLIAWADATPLKKGLPVGLPAAAVVANIALVELDRLIEREVVPIYYGRYVDDIMLVMENGANFQSPGELWEWLFSRSGDNLSWVKNTDKSKIQFNPDYLRLGRRASNIRFSNGKNKVFLLVGEAGKNLVDAITQQVQKRASEWRSLPSLPDSADDVGTDLLEATQSDGEAADNFRKTDAFTMQRAKFAIKLRDFEAYERDLHPDTWQEHRRAFFRAFIQHVVVLPHFFELATYLPRVIKLATACEDFAELRKIARALGQLTLRVEEDCSLSIKSVSGKYTPQDQDVVNCWIRQLICTFKESVESAFPPILSEAGRASWKENMNGGKCTSLLETALTTSRSIKAIQKSQAQLFNFDLAHIPFRFLGLPQEMIAQRGMPRGSPIEECINAEDLLPRDVILGSSILAKWANFVCLPRAMIFSTRPFNLAELSILNQDGYRKKARDDMRSVVLGVRGFILGNKTPRFKKNGTLQIPIKEHQKQVAIAVSSWKTEMGSWIGSVTRNNDPDVERFFRINRLLNGILSGKEKCRYLILPELALPARWFVRIARKLQAHGISLISGVEYIHAPNKIVRNQVWAALSHDGLGFSSIMIYRQDKQRPALHEELELHRLSGIKMFPSIKWKNPPVIDHGGFRFALLVCSELTNISYRDALRGKVDALFVPEWNQDIDSFDALVESAALDVHAYVVQCNDRAYGDSRIRAPYKDGWRRDVLRVKGGVADYCVIGEINILALRQYQSGYRTPPALFKPVPDGFKIHKLRKTQPI